jgi:predicted DsbA family dithiol-disulfide isomerase
MTRNLAVTFDYRCPFAYRGHTAVIDAVRGGADLDVRYVAFSLDQTHIPEGEPPVWDRDPSEWGTGVLALCFGIAVRDHFPDQFIDAHIELFEARHVHGGKLAEEPVLREAVARAGLDPDAVAAIAHSPETLATLAKEHAEMVDSYAVFGVPTFIEGDEAVFVRLMEVGRVDDFERFLDMMSWTRLNEFKRTRIPY